MKATLLLLSLSMSLSVASQVTLLTDVNRSSGSLRSLAVYEDNLYFGAGELLRYSPENNVTIAANINPVVNSFPRNLTVFDNRLFFNANSGTNNGMALYAFDSTDGATLIADVNMTNTAADIYKEFTVFGDDLIMVIDDSVIGEELYTYNPQTGVELISDINTGSDGSDPKNLFVYNGSVFFSADDGTNTRGRELYRYNAADGVRFVANIGPDEFGSNPDNFAIYKNELYFSASDFFAGTELFKYNEEDGVALVADIRAGIGGSSPQDLTVYRDELYFSANRSVGAEVYKYNPTDGVDLVADINQTSGTASSNPNGFIVYNDVLYFEANDGITGNELYSINSNAFLSQVQDIRPGQFGSNPEDFTIYREELYFTANDGESRVEIFKLGTTASLDDLHLKNNFLKYNQTSKQLSNTLENSEVAIYNLAGQLLLTSSDNNIDLHHFSNGVYIATVSNDGLSEQLKFVR